MNWNDDPPPKPGFYYYQPPALRSVWGDNAVKLVQVAKYKHREGFCAETMESIHGSVREAPAYSGELDKIPPGRWAGPLPQPGVARKKVPPPPGYIERFEQMEQERDRFKAFAEHLAALCIKHGVIAPVGPPMAGVTVTLDLTKKA